MAGGNGRARAERDHDRGRLSLARLARRPGRRGRRGRRGGSGGLGVELGEEGVGGLLALARAAPHDLAAPVVGYEREVVVLALPADLVDPDVIEVVEPVSVQLVVAHALDDPPDRAPVDPQHLRDRRLVGPGRHPRDQAFEVPRELRARPGERHALGPRPMLRTPQPPAPAVDLQPPDPQIEMPPHRVLRPRVLPRPRRVPALRADEPPAAKRHLNDHPVGLEPDLLHHHPLAEAQKPGKCRRDAHAVPPCKPLTLDSQQPASEGGGRVANQRATSANFLSREKPRSTPQSGSHRVHIDAGRPVFRTLSGCQTSPNSSPPLTVASLISRPRSARWTPPRRSSPHRAPAAKRPRSRRPYRPGRDPERHAVV